MTKSEVKPSIQDYYKILEPNFPKWLTPYIETSELQKQKDISVTCGTIYTDLFDSKIFYSSLDHSIAVALIIWHFTHDKVQTLAGLFHDIATPAFKHCVDFLNGDYMTQESTEDLTSKIIKDSEEIMALLKKDNIWVDEIDDYHLYPIADNDTPKLSADRLEYSLSNALFTYELLNAKDIKEIYDDIEVQSDINGIAELGFKTKAIARKFVKITSKLSVIYREDRTRYSMQFIADILKSLKDDGKIGIEDLYNLKESDVIDIIRDSKYSHQFDIWQKAKKVETSDTEPTDCYFVHHGAKIRYIDPLLKGQRISCQCKIADAAIKNNLSYQMDRYVYLPGIIL